MVQKLIVRLHKITMVKMTKKKKTTKWLLDMATRLGKEDAKAIELQNEEEE